MECKELFSKIECLLFVSGEPIEIKELRTALEMTDIEMRSLLGDMQTLYESEKRGIRLYITDEAVQLVTNPEYIDFVERFFSPPQEKAISQSMLETLAIIAYRQPVTRGDLEAIRGVRCEYAIAQLLKQGLIEERGKRDAVGHPMQFGTTDAFLRFFGICSLSELPAIDTEPLDDSA